MHTAKYMTGSLLLLAGVAHAQTASLIWQVSTDGGMSWSNTAIVDGPGSVLIRGRFEWEGVAGALGFGGSQFDAVIQNTAAGDLVSNISRPSPFNFAAQTLVASNYSNGIKIDVASDAAEPGAGTGWVNPGQGTPDGIGTNFIQENPAVVFTYTLNVSAIEGTRIIYNAFNPTAGRALSIYTSAAGAQTRLSAGQLNINTAHITVIPTPSTTALCALGALAASRRRRSRGK